MWRYPSPHEKLTSAKADWTWKRVTRFCTPQQKDSKNDAFIEFYDVSRPLYLETDASGVSLRLRLLQIMDGMKCMYDKVSHNATLHPIAFASKSL